MSILSQQDLFDDYAVTIRNTARSYFKPSVLLVNTGRSIQVQFREPHSSDEKELEKCVDVITFGVHTSGTSYDKRRDLSHDKSQRVSLRKNSHHI